MRRIHRYSAIIFGLFILMWSITGFVMIYHPFPRVQESERLERRTGVDMRRLPSIDSVFALLPENHGKVKAVKLHNVANRPLFTIITERGVYRYFADSLERFCNITSDVAEEILSHWSNGSRVTRIDTLWSSDVWLLGNNISGELPIYKYVLEEDASAIYISSKTGEVMQRTTLTSRLWSYFGAIPHWLYITKLRENGGKSWSRMGMWISGLSIVVALSGIVIGVKYLLISWRRRGRVTPFRKFWWRWHHLSGVAFGLILLSFLFSGFISFSKIPEWIIPIHTPKSIKQDFAIGDIAADSAAYNYREALSTCASRDVGEIKLMEMCQFGERLYYRLYTDRETILINSAEPYRVIMEVAVDDIVESVSHINSGERIVSVDYLTQYDGLYISRRGRLPLPVVRTILDDADGSHYYISTRDLKISYFNNNARWTRYLYHGLHRIETPWSVKHPTIWTVIMWLFLIGSTAISLTGFGLWLYRIKKRGGGKG